VKDFNNEFLTPLLLDIIIAMGIRFESKGMGDMAVARAHVDRARKDLIQELENPKIATVQALYLLAVWHLGHGKAEDSWTLNGQFPSILLLF